MKNSVLAVLCLAAWTGVAFGQGDLNWSAPGASIVVQTNTTAYSSFISSPGNLGGTQGLTFGSGTTLYYYELLYSTTQSAVPTSISQLAVWSDSGLNATNGPGNNGRLVAENNPSNGDTYIQAPVSGLAAATTANFIIVGWSANLGNSWSTILNLLENFASDPDVPDNAFFGVSAMGAITPNGASPGTTVFGASTPQISNPAGNPMELYLLPNFIPEPATLALAIIGGTSMLLFRRKNAGVRK